MEEVRSMKITIVYYDGEKTVRETRGGKNK